MALENYEGHELWTFNCIFSFTTFATGKDLPHSHLYYTKSNKMIDKQLNNTWTHEQELLQKFLFSYYPL